MKKVIIIILIYLPFFSFSQEIEKVLSEIEQNNTSLKAYQGLAEAQKLETHTGISPENPEVGFNYLWGDPSVIGKRHDISVTQSFDFPTVYGLKKQIATSENEQIELDFQIRRLEILATAKSVCYELIYLNAMNNVLVERLGHAREIADAYKASFENGDANILEKNKAALNLLNAKNELEKNETERTMLLSELESLNGGNPVSFSETGFPLFELPASFVDWYRQIETRIPGLKQTRNRVDIQQKEIQLNKAESLPKISTGYMSESVTGESYKGIALGLSIPLWENKNKVKTARAKKIASEQLAADAQVMYYNHLKAQFEKSHKMQGILTDYKETLPAINNEALLKKALDAGQISLIDYMLELSLYYETIDKILETEKELNMAVSELYYFEL